jgi:hypothetical protein
LRLVPRSSGGNAGVADQLLSEAVGSLLAHERPDATCLLPIFCVLVIHAFQRCRRKCTSCLVRVSVTGGSRGAAVFIVWLRDPSAACLGLAVTFFVVLRKLLQSCLKHRVPVHHLLHQSLLKNPIITLGLA